MNFIKFGINKLDGRVFSYEINYLASGIYFIEVGKGNKTKKIKFIKE